MRHASQHASQEVGSVTCGAGDVGRLPVVLTGLAAQQGEYRLLSDLLIGRGWMLPKSS